MASRRCFINLLRPLSSAVGFSAIICKWPLKLSACGETSIRTKPFKLEDAAKALPFNPEDAICLELPESEGPLLYRQVLRYIHKHGDVRSFRIGGGAIQEGGAGLGWFKLCVSLDGIMQEVWVLHQSLGPACGMHLPRLYHSLVLFIHATEATTVTHQKGRTILECLVKQAQDEATEPEIGIPLWRFDPKHCNWQHMASRPMRPWDSVVLPGNLARSLEEDAIWFHSETTKARYQTLGISYHRTYLFSGPPGAGKTSAAAALAGRFGRPLCLLPEPELSDGGLLAAIAKGPSRALFLFEDAKVTVEGLRSLLNALDGVTTPEDAVFILTTNTPDALLQFPALVRPGRIDLHLRFPPPDGHTAAALFRRFFSVDAEHWTPSSTFQAAWSTSSMAELQHWLLECDKRSLSAASCSELLERVRKGTVKIAHGEE